MAKKTVETEIYLLFDIKGITEEMDEGVLLAVQIAAEKMVADAERRFLSKVGATTKYPSRSTGRLGSIFKDWKSRYENGGWLGGIYGTNAPIGKTPGSKNKDWEYTIGARAMYFEYGRSAPGRGKSKGGPQSVRQRPQKPRMFLRPARNKIKRELNGITGKEIMTVARRLNRNPQLNRRVMSIANRIA